MPGADDLDPVGVVVRLVGVNDPRVALELLREGEARMARREEDVREDAAPVELEAAVHGPDALDAGPAEALVPAGLVPQLVDVVEELVDGRVVAVAGALGRAERRCGAGRPRARRGPGNEVGAQWPSLSERIRRWRIAAARTRQAAAGSGSVPNTAISAGSRPPFRRVA